MIRYSIGTALALAIALCAGSPAPAQTATPAPSPTPFQGFTATGTLAVQAQVSGAPVNVDARVAVMTKAHRIRMDVLHLEMSAGDPSASAMSALLPRGTITMVYDQPSTTMTIWSEQKRVYYQMKLHSTSIRKPAPNHTSSSQIDQFLGATKTLTEYDVLSQTLTLVGHLPVNGHTASMMHFTIQSQKHGGKLQDLSGDLAFADDLSGIPVRFWITAKGAFNGSTKLDLLSASTTPPNNSVFAVPAGYKKVDKILEVLSNMPATAP